MSAINFDQPSIGNVNNNQDALSVKNTGSGSALVGESTASDGVRGLSESDAHAGVSAINDRGGFAVWARGNSHFENATAGAIWAVTSQEFSSCIGAEAKNGPAVSALSTGGVGVDGRSQESEGIHGESSSATWAGVAGIQTSTGPGVWGSSQGGEGVHGETNAGRWAAVAAINKGGGPGIWASGTPAGHFEGNVEVTGDVLLTGQDLAEDFALPQAQQIEPGTVMIIDNEDALQVSSQAYDKRVAGVISGAGNLRPGIVLGRQESGANRMPIALIGRVYCKVDADYAPIATGDLLTASPTPGHAMKADDLFKAFGSVIGKALRPLQSGQDLIPILIALQ